MKHAKAPVKRFLIICGTVLLVGGGTAVAVGTKGFTDLAFPWFDYGSGENTPDDPTKPDTTKPDSEDSGNQKDNVHTYYTYSDLIAEGAKNYAIAMKTDYADKLASISDWHATAVYLYDDNSAEVSMFSGEFEQWVKVSLSLQSPYKGAKTIDGMCYGPDGTVLPVNNEADLQAIRATKNHHVTKTEFVSKELNQLPFTFANAYTTGDKSIRTGVLRLSNIEKDNARCEVEFDTVDWKGDTVYAVNTTTVSANIAPIQAYADEHKVSFEQATADMIMLDKQVGLTLQERKDLAVEYATDKTSATILTVDYSPSL